MLVYNDIINGNIEQSLQKICEILSKNDEDLEKLEEEFVNICSYIGTHMDITHCRRWIDIMNNVKVFVNESKIMIDKTLELCCKLCILCKSVHETKQMPIKKLRDHVIQYFDKTELNQYQLKLFEDILPHMKNESYNIACNICSTFIKFIIDIENTHLDDKNIFHLSNHLRLCIEYITRRDVYIENGINRDSDCTWFLWGMLVILSSNNSDITIAYELFKFRWKQSFKKHRIGLLWGSIFIVILSRKHISSPEWGIKDCKIFDKIRSMSTHMMNETKNKIKISNTEKESDGLNLLVHYTPKKKESFAIQQRIPEEFEKKNITLL